MRGSTFLSRTFRAIAWASTWCVRKEATVASRENTRQVDYRLPRQAQVGQNEGTWRVVGIGKHLCALQQGSEWELGRFQLNASGGGAVALSVHPIGTPGEGAILADDSVTIAANALDFDVHGSFVIPTVYYGAYTGAHLNSNRTPLAWLHTFNWNGGLLPRQAWISE